jgi:general secretion pathway protein D
MIPMKPTLPELYQDSAMRSAPGGSSATNRAVGKRRLRVALLTGLVALALAGCAANPVLEQSRRDFATGDRVAALVRLAQAVKEDPGNAELRSYYYRQRDQVVLEKLGAAERAQNAGRLDEAQAHYRALQTIDPENPRARIGLEELERGRRRTERLVQARAAFAAGDATTALRLVRGVLAEAPGDRVAREMMRELDERAERARTPQAEALQGAMAKPVTLEFREAPLRVVFEALSRASGLNFVFDKDVRADSRVTLFVRDSTVDEVLRLLAATQGIERKLLNANSVLIYPSTTAKQREHVDLVTRSFYLANADAKAAQTMLKQLVKSRDVFIEEKLNLVVMKDTPDAVRMAERLIATLDVPEPEVMLELEVLEVSRSKLLDLGIDFPDQVGYGLLTPSIPAASQIINGVVISGTTELGGKLLDGNINLKETGGLVPFVSNPAAVLRLRSEDGDSSTLANPRIRVRNRDKAKIHIGDKLPVFTTTSTANVGVSASVAYLDVGLKLEVEPSVYRDDEVGIKLNLEVSNIVREVPGPASPLAYQVGTRSASTVLRLKNGETQVLAGLINDEDRSAAQRLPGLGNLPVLGRLFSAQRDSNNKTEIALLITPRILRNVLPPVALLADMPAGTEASVGTEPLRLGPTAPGSLGLLGDGRAGAGGPPPPPAAVPAERLPPVPPPQVVPEVVAPEVAVNVPDSVRRGESVNASIRFEGLAGAGGGEVTVVYDAARLDADGASAPGIIKLPLTIAEGNAEVTVSLRAKPDAGGTATVVVTGLTLRRDGEDEAVPMSAGATIRIVECGLSRHAALR